MAKNILKEKKLLMKESHIFTLLALKENKRNRKGKRKKVY